MKNDVLRDFMERLLQEFNKHQCDGFSEDIVREVERQVRRDWAGERPLIRKDPDREERRAAAASDLRRGVPVQQVMSARGISRSALYRLYKDKP